MRPPKKLFVVVGITLPVLALAAVGWSALLDQGGGSAVHFGARIEGREPFARNPDELFAPASTSKLFTAGAALAKLGPEFRFETLLRFEQVGSRAANLELVGGGDPTWGLPQFQSARGVELNRMAQALRAAGVTEVEGEPRAVFNNPLWNSISIPEGWKPSDTESCMGAIAQAFNISQNCATYRVSGLNAGAWTTPGLRFPVEHQLRAGSSTSIGTKPVRGERGWRFVLTGTLKPGATPSFTLPVLDTRPWAQALFRESLAAAGIRILPTAGDAPRGESKVLRFPSPPLKEILKPFLKNSNNFLGDAVLKSLAGGRHFGPAAGDAPNRRADGILEASLAGLRSWLLGLGLPRDFTLHDGSGLSRTSRVTPRFLLEFLDRANREPWFPALWDALAVAGVDGTLRNRMKGTAAEARLRGKTGTLDGVYNLAGYVPRGNDYVPFAILTRTTGAHSGDARAAEDRVGVALARLHASLPFVSEEHGEPIVPYPYYPEQAGFDDQ